MPNLLPAYYLSQDYNFRGRVTSAGIAYALALPADASPASIALANKLVTNAVANIDPVAWGVAVHPPIADGGPDQSQVTDEQIEDAVAVVWESVATVLAEQ